jgi:hypothetical protein
MLLELGVRSVSRKDRKERILLELGVLGVLAEEDLFGFRAWDFGFSADHCYEISLVW